MVVDPQVFLGPQAQRERKETQAYQVMASKEALAPLDSPALLALLDFRAQLVRSHRID